MADPVIEHEPEIEEEEEDVVVIMEFTRCITTVGRINSLMARGFLPQQEESLKVAGLTGIKVLWTLFERRVQPLKARAHPLYRYTGDGDPTRMSPEVLAPVEVRSRVWTVIKRSKDVEDDTAELDRHQ
ncbi:hypothetical protein BAE44_0025119, partial [Dichanthelium oligosanthes]